MPMDTTALFLGYSALWIAIAAFLGALVIWKYGKHLSLRPVWRTWIALGLAVLGVLSVFAMAGITWTGQEGASIASGARYEVTMSESEPQTTVDNALMEINVHCQFNYNTNHFKLGTGNFTVNFTLDRVDSSTVDDTTSASCTDVGLVASHSGGDDEALVLKSSSQYQLKWTKAVNPDASVISTVLKTGTGVTVHVAAGGANWVSMNCTLNDAAVDMMVPYVPAHIYFSIGGVQIVANIEVTSYAGTPPT